MSNEDFPRDLHERLLETRNSLIGRSSNDSLSYSEYRRVESVILSLIEYLASRKDTYSAQQLLDEHRRFTGFKRPTVENARQLLDFIRIYEIERPQTNFVQRRLERKIATLERELSRLRSNPALEKKVAKLEEDLRKLKVASVALEGNKKEQKDMLKNYKGAEKRVFVIMPFAQIFDDVWKGGIERACNSEDFGYMRVDKISLSSWITEDIVNYIELADFVIADISGNNPNVMFELGWALAKDRKPIVIRQENDPNKVPFDVKDIRYISYTNSWSGIERLYRDICKFLKTTSEIAKEEVTKKKTRQKKTKKAKEDQ